MTIDNFLENNIYSQEINLFCGAGISFNSGIPIVSVITKEILKNLDCEEDDIKLFHQNPFSFESFIETINSHENFQLKNFVNIFIGGKSNNNHQLIAKLCQRKLLKNIITTNFDCLIEEALTNEHTKFNKFIDEKEYSLCSFSAEELNLIKIHGCTSSIESIRTTLKKIASYNLVAERDNIIKAFFKSSQKKPIIFLGYSFSDHFDINNSIKKYSNEDNIIIIVQHEWDSDKERIIKLSEEPNNLFSKSKGYKIFIDTDKFVRLLYQKLDENYNFEKNEYEWKAEINSLFQNFQLFQKYNLLGILFKGKGLEKTNSFYINKAFKNLPKNVSYKSKIGVIFNMTMSDIELNYGTAFNKNLEIFEAELQKNDFDGKLMLLYAISSYYFGRDFQNSIKLIEESLPLFHSATNVKKENLIEYVELNNAEINSVLGAYCISLEYSNRFNEALIIRKKLLENSIKNGDVLMIAAHKLGIANNCNQTKKFIESLEIYDEIIILADFLGNEELKIIALTNSGTILIVELKEKEKGKVVMDELKKLYKYNDLSIYNSETFRYLEAYLKIQELDYDAAKNIFFEIMTKALEDKRFNDYLFFLNQLFAVLIDYKKDFRKVIELSLNFIDIINKNEYSLNYKNSIERDVFYNIGMAHFYCEQHENSKLFFMKALKYDTFWNDKSNISLDLKWIKKLEHI